MTYRGTKKQKKEIEENYGSVDEFLKDIKEQSWEDHSDLTVWHYRRAITAVVGRTLNNINNDNERRSVVRNIAEILGLMELR